MKKYRKLDFNTEDLESLSNSELKKVADHWLRQYLLNQPSVQNDVEKHCSVSFLREQRAKVCACTRPWRLPR